MKIKNSLISSAFVLAVLFSFQTNAHTDESEQLTEYVPAGIRHFCTVEL